MALAPHERSAVKALARDTPEALPSYATKIGVTPTQVSRILTATSDNTQVTDAKASSAFNILDNLRIGQYEKARQEAQTLYGRVNANVYSNLRTLVDAGAIFGEDMLPEVAYIKLGWILGHTRNLERVREMMTKNLVGEISERTDARTFLY